MPSGVSAYNSASLLLLVASWPSLCVAAPWTGLLSRRSLLVFDYSPAPPPEEGPPLSVGALRDPSFLPVQIGGIVGAYALSLVLVALLLLALSKVRREALRNRDNPIDPISYEFNPFPQPFLLQSEEEYKRQLEEFQSEEEYQRHLEQYQPEEAYRIQTGELQKLSLQTNFPVPSFSFPSASPLSPSRTGPLSPSKSQHSFFTTHSPTSTILAAGVDLSVDQAVVQRDAAMRQQELEDMYRHVMEQEQAKAEGREYHPPVMSPAASTLNMSPVKVGKKERNKPSSLNLSRDEKAQSRGSSIFSFLKSPRKNKAPSGLSISSPIMTPITQSIDSRIDAAVGKPPSRAARRKQREEARTASNHSRDISAATSTISDEDEDDTHPHHHPNEPASATSEKSTTHLVGLPCSPRPGVTRFPSGIDSLPASRAPTNKPSSPTLRHPRQLPPPPTRSIRSPRRRRPALTRVRTFIAQLPDGVKLRDEADCIHARADVAWWEWDADGWAANPLDWGSSAVYAVPAV
ncbi:hypothetical protein N0V88_005380 [Collariella sp. IMI 366227]|nr:hypothetical protein N0V88_005380 [Collariella sp. IMI 366227]